MHGHKQAAIAAMILVAPFGAAQGQTSTASPPPPPPPVVSVAAPATQPPATLTPATQPNVSNFVRCDGRKGHAGFFEKMGQLVAITATAGLAGAMTNDLGSVDKRFSGRQGIAACDAAIAEEGNEHRRVELGIARTVHFIEAEDLPGALASVRAVPGLAGKLAADAGFKRGLGAAVTMLEADVLLRMGQVAEAEATAARAARAADYELVGVLRAASYLSLSQDITAEKLAAVERGARLYPRLLLDLSEYHGWRGDYRAGAARTGELIELTRGFAGEVFHDEALMARQSIYLMMAGDMAASNALAEAAAAKLAITAAGAEAAKYANVIAETDEQLAMQRIGRLAAEGNLTRARQLFGARDRWLKVSAPIVVDMATRLRQGARPEELAGALDIEPQAQRAAYFNTRIASLTKAEKAVDRLYVLALANVSSKTLAGAGGAVWKTGSKPRFLLKRGKDAKFDFDIASTELRLYGREAGEALLLHCALIARDRGVQGFVVSPSRVRTDMLVLRFGNAGDPGLPASALLDAKQVIADLAPLIPEPTPAR